MSTFRNDIADYQYRWCHRAVWNINYHFAGPKRIGNFAVIVTLTRCVKINFVLFTERREFDFLLYAIEIEKQHVCSYCVIGTVFWPWRAEALTERRNTRKVHPMSSKWTVSKQNLLKLLCGSQGLPWHTPHMLMPVSPSVLFDEISVVTERISSILCSVSLFAVAVLQPSPILV